MFVVVVVDGQDLYAVQDCGGQRMLYYGNVNGNTVLTSTPQLAADVFGLKTDINVERLLNSKGYYRGSGFLPGNISPFKELKRLGPNTCLRSVNGVFNVERIYPRAERTEFITDEEKNSAIDRMHNVLSNNIAIEELSLYSHFWDRS